ncbi:DUF4097 family beta strand repeat-containing protein [Catenulispora pinisilvae]|uniref:DUF4097 family beta strand repeat-containing protein n=1 Tax=Catenulispora pinisilvae TaxID=2705253 RepID=UPI001891B913|nr:DUF4097 family beta strand repeat-containing protein [Catenulispora pinisilvae]
MQKFDTPNPVSVVLEIPAGLIRLIAGERTDTTVEVLPSDASKKRDVKAAEKTTVEFQDGVLRIATADPNKVLGSSGSLDVTISLPAGSRFQGQAGAAELHSTGRLGEVTFDGGYQTVALDEVGSAHLKAHTGEVTVARLTGPAEITNGKGDITVAEAVSGAVVLTTGMGNLSVTAAPGVSGTLDASTGHGRVDNALRNTEGAGAALTIKATTSSGDISASSR